MWDTFSPQVGRRCRYTFFLVMLLQIAMCGVLSLRTLKNCDFYNYGGMGCMLNLKQLLHLQNSVHLPQSSWCSSAICAACFSLDSTSFKCVICEMTAQKTMCCILFKDSEVNDCIFVLFYLWSGEILYVSKLLLSLKSEGCLQFLIVKCLPVPSDEENEGAGVQFFPFLDLSMQIIGLNFCSF